MKSVFALSALMWIISASAHASEAIEAIQPSAWEDAKYNVAQIVNNQAISGISPVAQLTTVYRGVLAAPFGVYLSVWDLVPTEGDDLTESKSFDLGNFASVPTVISKKVRKIGAEDAVLELTLKAKLLNDDKSGSEAFKLLISVSVKGGQVKGPLYLKRIK